MNKPVVLFDADGFLLDFFTPALAVANKLIEKAEGEGFRHLVHDDFKTWDIFDVIGEKYQDACYKEYEKPGFCLAFEPLPGAVEGVWEAQKMADVVVVTSPLHSETWCHERRLSLEKHFSIPAKNVIFASRKSLVMGRILVDDRVEHVRNWSAEHSHRGGVGVIWDQHNNRTEDPGKTMLRCTSWTGANGLLEVIENLARYNS